MKTKLIAAAAFGVVLAVNGDNVFDGLKFVMDIRGDGPSPLNGAIGNMLDSGQSVTQSGGDADERKARIVRETLVPPALPWETNSVNALYLPQTYRSDNNWIQATALTFGGCAVKTTTQTAYVRFKWKGAPNPAQSYSEWLVLDGYDWNTTAPGASSAGVGWGVGIVNVANASPAKGRLVCMIPTASQIITWNNKLDIYPDVWYELFVEIKPAANDGTKSTIKLYLMKEPASVSGGGQWNVPVFESESVSGLKKLEFVDSKSDLRLGAETPCTAWQGADASYGAYSKGFNGIVASTMMWDRTLTEEERWQVVRNAFGYDWRLGSPNGSAAEFAADGSALAKRTVVAKADAVGVVPDQLTEANPTLTIRSPIVDREAGLGKMLSVEPLLSDGAAATVSVAVNGTSIGTYDLSSSDRNIVIPGACWHAGPNGFVDLAITRLAPFAGVLQFDAITLCGSWKMSGAMSQEGYARSRYDIGVTSPLSMQRATAVATWGRKDTIKIMSYVPANAANVARYSFSVKVKGMGTLSQKPDTDQPHEFYLNGHKFAAFPAVTDGLVLKAAVPAEFLLAGENMFEVRNLATMASVDRYVVYDFYQIDVRQQKGLMLLLR